MASPPVNVRRSKMRSLSNSEIFVVFTYYTLKQWDNSAQQLQAIIAAQRLQFWPANDPVKGSDKNAFV